MKKPKKKHSVGFLRWVLLFFFGWALLGGFFECQPWSDTTTGNIFLEVKLILSILKIWLILP